MSARSRAAVPDVRPRADVPVWAAARVVLAQVWPLLALAGAASLASAVVALTTGGIAPAQATWWFVRVAVLGLVGSFVLHETMHLLVLRRVGTVRTVLVTRERWRVSLTPVGTMTPRQVATTALAGPAACVLLGFVLLPVDALVAAVHLAHVVQLLPLFGDGRALVHAARGRGLRADDGGRVSPSPSPPGGPGR